MPDTSMGQNIAEFEYGFPSVVVPCLKLECRAFGMLADLTPEQRALAEYMSELSEKAWHAGWIAHLEYDLWRAINGGTSSFGQMFLTQVHLQILRNLSERCCGWIVYTESEETFVPIDEWKKKYEAYRAKR